MLEALFSALATILSGPSLFFLILGVLIGLVVGVIPGFGGTVGLSLLLPFVFGMEPVSGIAMMMGLMSVVATSDTFPAVLIGVPGSVSAQATVMDGFPLAKKGQAARALSAAFFSSLFGGLFGAVILTAIIQIAKPIILAFGTGEMLMLAIFGISVVGTLTGSSIFKGLAAACLGMIVGCIGISPASSEYRLDFSTMLEVQNPMVMYLGGGIHLMVVAISIFAFPEIVELLRSNKAVSEKAELEKSGWLKGLKDFLKNKFLVLRCSFIGSFIGLIPGIGGSCIDWISYSHAKTTVKDNENFGNGDIRGVIGPESSSNSKEGGALVPTLLFGIPGSGGTAILMGGLILLGVDPGIQMIDTQLDLIYTIIWSLAVANIFGAIICVAMAKPISKLTTINFTVLAPFLISLILFAIFNSTRSWGDLIFATFIGVMAVFMKRYDYSRVALMIGFVLSDSIETYLYQTMQFYEFTELFTRPIFLVLILVSVFSIYSGIKIINKKDQLANQNSKLINTKTKSQWMFLLILAFIGVYTIFVTDHLQYLGKVFPISIGIFLSIFCSIIGAQMYFGNSGAKVFHDTENLIGQDPKIRSQWLTIFWFISPLFLSVFIGFYISIGLFVFIFLKKIAKKSLNFSLLSGLFVWIFLGIVSHFMVMDFPPGILQSYVELPWPLS
ncbi:tripartite tricarboxylate transporter permease [Candidatus Pelagibacter sp.]|jgi:putative tricarboxylic transport membrane protein|nr:tripartite tricarboxylate transporter permease [Candidatus Pelagibacter sp.]|tara:strand:+ start:997 stop:3003 length:2007 start_codon:yes stop_codon:yes gene_type:complete